MLRVIERARRALGTGQVMQGVMNPRNLGRFVSRWMALAGFYWWLISKVEAQQLVAAGIIGFAVAVAVGVVEGTTNGHWPIKGRWLGILMRRLPAKAVRDVGLLGVQLWRSIRGGAATGALKSIPFKAGNDTAQSRSRRALVIAGISMPPNSIAISVEPNQGEMVVHELVSQSEVPRDKEWPL